MDVRANFIWDRGDAAGGWHDGTDLQGARHRYLAFGAGLLAYSASHNFLHPSESRRLLDRQYRPLVSQPALFRRFAEIEETEGAFLRFFLRYGALGLEDSLLTQDGSPAYGESFETWVSASRTIRALCNVWEAVRTADGLSLLTRLAVEDEGPLSPVARHEGVRKVRFSWSLAPQGALARALSDFPLTQTAQGATSELAQIAITYAGEALVAHTNALLEAFAQPRLERSPQTRALELVLSPRNLFGAMAAQLASAIALDRRYRCCDHCGEWYAISVGVRLDRRYCTDSCKQAAYRQRRRGEEAGPTHNETVEAKNQASEQGE
jgi:hypothetical protein